MKTRTLLHFTSKIKKSIRSENTGMSKIKSTMRTRSSETNFLMPACHLSLRRGLLKSTTALATLRIIKIPKRKEVVSALKRETAIILKVTSKSNKRSK